MKTYLVVAALIHSGEDVLLVHQQAPSDSTPSYSLPGGVVEPGELLTGALVREVREETGLEVTAIGSLLYALHGVNLVEGTQTLAYGFDVSEWRGGLRQTDPDRLVLSVQFWSRAQAIELLEQHLPWRTMREPVLAYLRGEVKPGAVWLYQAGATTDIRLVGRLE